MSVGKICSRVVATATPDETIRDAARRMEENDVGTLVVVEPGSVTSPIGMLTDRDLAIRCVAKGLDPDKTPVSKLMSQPIQSIDESTPIEDTIGQMVRSGTRRLIVTDADQRLIGIVTLDDIMSMLGEEAGAISRLLEKQAPHIPA